MQLAESADSEVPRNTGRTFSISLFSLSLCFFTCPGRLADPRCRVMLYISLKLPCEGPTSVSVASASKKQVVPFAVSCTLFHFPIFAVVFLLGFEF